MIRSVSFHPLPAILPVIDSQEAGRSGAWDSFSRHWRVTDPAAPLWPPGLVVPLVLPRGQLAHLLEGDCRVASASRAVAWKEGGGRAWHGSAWDLRVYFQPVRQVLECRCFTHHHFITTRMRKNKSVPGWGHCVECACSSQVFGGFSGSGSLSHPQGVCVS